MARVLSPGERRTVKKNNSERTGSVIPRVFSCPIFCQWERARVSRQALNAGIGETVRERVLFAGDGTVQEGEDPRAELVRVKVLFCRLRDPMQKRNREARSVPKKEPQCFPRLRLHFFPAEPRGLKTGWLLGCSWDQQAAFLPP